MRTKTIEIKQKSKGNKVEVWIIQTSLDLFGKVYKKKRLFDDCYKHEKRRLKQILQQADNIYGFNGIDLDGKRW